MKIETKNEYERRILNVIDFINSNLDNSPTLDELAEVACFSKYHFHRVFQGLIGESVAEYIRRLKLERAANDLIHSQKTVSDLAFDTGYETVEAFTKSFKRRFGLTPSNFRTDQNSKRIKILLARDTKFIRGEHKMKVEMKTLNRRKVAYVRHIGPYNQCKKAWEQLCTWAGPKGLLGKDTTFLGLCYDDPQVTPEDKIRYDACITLNQDLTADGNIGIKELPEGEYATTIHKGPYDKLHQTYIELCGQWAPKAGRELSHEPSVEIYLNDPERTPPEELLVEIQYQVK